MGLLLASTLLLRNGYASAAIHPDDLSSYHSALRTAHKQPANNYRVYIDCDVFFYHVNNVVDLSFMDCVRGRKIFYELAL